MVIDEKAVEESEAAGESPANLIETEREPGVVAEKALEDPEPSTDVVVPSTSPDDKYNSSRPEEAPKSETREVVEESPEDVGDDAPAAEEDSKPEDSSEPAEIVPEPEAVEGTEEEETPVSFEPVQAPDVSQDTDSPTDDPKEAKCVVEEPETSEPATNIEEFAEAPIPADAEPEDEEKDSELATDPEPVVVEESKEIEKAASEGDAPPVCLHLIQARI